MKLQRLVFFGNLAVSVLWLLLNAASFFGLLYRNLHRFFCAGFATGSPLEVGVGGEQVGDGALIRCLSQSMSCHRNDRTSDRPLNPP